MRERRQRQIERRERKKKGSAQWDNISRVQITIDLGRIDRTRSTDRSHGARSTVLPRNTALLTATTAFPACLQILQQIKRASSCFIVTWLTCRSGDQSPRRAVTPLHAVNPDFTRVTDPTKFLRSGFFFPRNFARCYLDSMFFVTSLHGPRLEFSMDIFEIASTVCNFL